MCFANANVLVGQERHITNCCRRDSLDESFKHAPLESFMTDISCNPNPAKAAQGSLGCRIREQTLSGLHRIALKGQVSKGRVLSI